MYLTLVSLPLFYCLQTKICPNISLTEFTAFSPLNSPSPRPPPSPPPRIKTDGKLSASGYSDFLILEEIVRSQPGKQQTQYHRRDEEDDARDPQSLADPFLVLE